MSAVEQLSDKQRAFLEHYLAGGFNATRAARLAGYEQPHSQGPRLLEHVGIKAAVSERLDAFAVPANEVLARLGAQARADPGEWIDERGAISIDLMQEAGVTHLIRELSWEEEERMPGRGQDAEPVAVRKRKVRLHDAQKALELLAKHHGLLKEVTQVQGPDGKRLQVEFVRDWRGTADGDEGE